MTIEGAIAQLQELIDNDEIPFWAKPSLRKVMETVEMEREQRIEESKTGKWIRANGRGGHECNQCNEYAPSTRCGTERFSPYCPNCGAKMEVDE